MLTPAPDWIEGLVAIAAAIGGISLAMNSKKNKESKLEAFQEREHKEQRKIDKQERNIEKIEQEKSKKKEKAKRIEEAVKANVAKMEQLGKKSLSTEEQAATMKRLQEGLEQEVEAILKEGGNEEKVEDLKKKEKELKEKLSSINEETDEKKKKELRKELDRITAQTEKIIRELIGDDEKQERALEDVIEAENKKAALSAKEEQSMIDTAVSVKNNIKRLEQGIHEETDEKRKRALQKKLDGYKEMLITCEKEIAGKESLKKDYEEAQARDEQLKRTITKEEHQLVQFLKDLENLEHHHDQETYIQHLFYNLRETIGTKYYIDAQAKHFRDLQEHIKRLDREGKRDYEHVNTLLKEWEREHRYEDEKGNWRTGPEHGSEIVEKTE